MPDLNYLEGLPRLPPMTADRARMWCQNSYRQHDPALCLGPLKDGTIDICALCGGQHLVEDCIYFSPQLVLQHVWHDRQCRPPVRTRISLDTVRITHLPTVVQSSIVASVQRVEFSKNMDHENANSRRNNSDVFLWKRQTMPWRKLLVKRPKTPSVAVSLRKKGIA